MAVLSLGYSVLEVHLVSPFPQTKSNSSIAKTETRELQYASAYYIF